MTNIGEIDEIKIIWNLVSNRGKTFPQLGKLSSIANYQGHEYPRGVTCDDIEKAPTGAKRDVMINGIEYSLKSTRAAPPAIVNHTTRDKWLRVCGKINVNIDMLDQMVSEYWVLREKRKIGEDVLVSNGLCPFGNSNARKEYLKKLVNYFLFDGSGSRDSLYPAKFILGFSDPNNPYTWTVYNKETAFNKMWPQMVFSVRSKKGMPPNYPDMKDITTKRNIEPWVRYINGDYRGSLHIRTR